METTKKEELAIAKRISDNKYNFIDENGNEQLFDRLDNFKDGFARVQRANGEWNFIGEFCKIDKNGKIVSSK